MEDEESDSFKIAQIMSMSFSRFSREKAARALAAKNGNVADALDMLLEGELAHEPPDALEQLEELFGERRNRDELREALERGGDLQGALDMLVEGGLADDEANAAGSVFQVRVPPGMSPGEAMVVRAPDGQQIQVDVPPGATTGSVFQVQVPSLDLGRQRGPDPAMRQRAREDVDLGLRELRVRTRERLEERHAVRDALNEAIRRLRQKYFFSSLRIPMLRRFQAEELDKVRDAFRGAHGKPMQVMRTGMQLPDDTNVVMTVVGRGERATKNAFHTRALRRLVSEGVLLVEGVFTDSADALYNVLDGVKLDEEEEAAAVRRARAAVRRAKGHGGKKSRRKKTKRRHKTGGKKSRKQRKHTTLKGGKRKRRRTRRRR